MECKGLKKSKQRKRLSFALILSLVNQQTITNLWQSLPSAWQYTHTQPAHFTTTRPSTNFFHTIAFFLHLIRWSSTMVLFVSFSSFSLFSFSFFCGNPVHNFSFFLSLSLWRQFHSLTGAHTHKDTSFFSIILSVVFISPRLVTRTGDKLLPRTTQTHTPPHSQH